MEAVEKIRTDLANESRVRMIRAGLLLLLLSVMTVGFAVGTGLKTDLGAHDLLVAAVGIGFILFGTVVSFSPDLRFGRVSAAALGVVAVVSPTFAATKLAEDSGPAWGGLGCFATLSVLGVVGLVAARLVLGKTRRRFGGASQLQAVAASLAAATAVGLHCPGASFAHLATHAGAAAVLALLVGRFVLR